MSGQINYPGRFHLLPRADSLSTTCAGRLIRLTLLESLKDISFMRLRLRHLLLLMILFLLSDHALQVPALVLRRALFQSALYVSHAR